MLPARARGFSLIELMIVVVIIGILASLARVGYRKYVGRARSSEAVAMLAEMSSKEQVYFLEFAQFLPLDNAATITGSAASGAGIDEAATRFYPRNPTASTFDSVRTAASVTALPLSWSYVAVRPKDTVLYCTYLADAGQAGSWPTGTIGAGVLGVSATPGIAQPWYYVIGECKLDIRSTPITTFVITYNSPTLKTMNEGN